MLLVILLTWLEYNVDIFTHLVLIKIYYIVAVVIHYFIYQQRHSFSAVKNNKKICREKSSKKHHFLLSQLQDRRSGVNKNEIKINWRKKKIVNTLKSIEKSWEQKKYTRERKEKKEEKWSCIAMLRSSMNFNGKFWNFWPNFIHLKIFFFSLQSSVFIQFVFAFYVPIYTHWRKAIKYLECVYVPF